MKIALLQINPTVGDLSGNGQLILDALAEAGARGADLAVTPELALVGYLPRDLLLDPAFVARSWDALGRLNAGAPVEVVSSSGSESFDREKSEIRMTKSETWERWHPCRRGEVGLL